MIKRRGIIAMKVASRLPQFTWSTDKHYNDEFYVTRERLQEMCVKKYDGKGYQFSLHPFRVVVIK